MKKQILVLGLAATILFSSCATICGGKIDKCQRTKPQAGQEQRQVRPVPLVMNILFFTPGLIVDFATGAAYKPCVRK